MLNSSISFIIPTRNRSEFIDPLIKRCLEIDNSIIIISDNSDTKVIDKIVDCYKTDRIIYNYYSEKLSVIENFNRALNYVNTSYVCYLGDDDMLGPGFEKAFQIQIQNNIDVLNVYNKNRPLQYFWPNNPSTHWGELGGMIFFGEFKGQFIKNNINKSLKHSLINFGEGPLGLPRIYLGIVSIELINKIKLKYGELFGGYSPDIFSSLLLSQECINPFYIDYPIIIPGACSKSTSSARANRKDIGDLLDNDHLGRFNNIIWDKRIPEFYSPYNVWASTSLIALKNLNKHISVKNISHIYSLDFMSSKNEMKKIFSSMRHLSSVSNTHIITIYFFTFLNLLSLLSQKMKNYIKLLFIRRPGASKYVSKNNATTYDAYIELKNFYLINNIDIENI